MVRNNLVTKWLNFLSILDILKGIKFFFYTVIKILKLNLSNNMESTNELSPLDSFTDEEISEKSVKRFEQILHNTFKRDGILTERIVVNEKATGMVVIQDLDNGGVWKATERYQVVTHKRLLKLVKRVAEELGINLTMLPQPAMEGYYGRYKTTSDGATIAKDGKYMLASMTASKQIVVNEDLDDKVEVGITVVNTMDGSTSVHIAPLVVRLLCMNQFHGFSTTIKGWQGSYNKKEFAHIYEKAKEAWSHSLKLQNTYPEVDMFLSAMTKRQTHTKSLTEEMMADKIAVQLELAVGYANDFKDLAKTPLTLEVAQKIVDAMPVSVNKELTTIVYERVGKKGEQKYNEVHLIPSSNGGTGVTEYDFFNNYTNILTHSTDAASSSIPSQLNRHKTLVRLFNFGNRRQLEVIAQ